MYNNSLSLIIVILLVIVGLVIKKPGMAF